MTRLRKMLPGHLDITPENYNPWRGRVLWYRTRTRNIGSGVSFRQVTLRERVGDAAIVEYDNGQRARIKLRRAEFHLTEPMVVVWTPDQNRLDVVAAGKVSTGRRHAYREYLLEQIRSIPNQDKPVSITALTHYLHEKGVVGFLGKPVARQVVQRLVDTYNLRTSVLTPHGLLQE